MMVRRADENLLDINAPPIVIELRTDSIAGALRDRSSEFDELVVGGESQAVRLKRGRTYTTCTESLNRRIRMFKGNGVEIGSDCGPNVSAQLEPQTNVEVDNRKPGTQLRGVTY